MRHELRWLLALCALSVLLWTACGRGGKLLDTVKATGTVKLDGQPVEGAAVTFAPQGPGGHAASAVTDASGRFVLTTEVAGDGAMPGTYLVAISKTERPSLSAPGGSGEDDMDAIYAAAEAAGQDVMGSGEKREENTSKNLLPEKYRDPKNSELTATVADGSDNDFTFELKSN